MARPSTCPRPENSRRPANPLFVRQRPAAVAQRVDALSKRDKEQHYCNLFSYFYIIVITETLFFSLDESPSIILYLCIAMVYIFTNPLGMVIA
jgi:hypothetical protein